MAEQPSWIRDHELVNAQTVLVTFLSALSGLVAVLDSDRRIVWASRDFCRACGSPVLAGVLGRRPGEALGCVHSTEGTNGCGSSPACYLCRVVETILTSRKLDHRVADQGSLEVRRAGGTESLALPVAAAPWVLEDRRFTVLTFGEERP